MATPEDIKVVRFELYPAEQPTCYCVGFSETYRNRTKYGDCQVPLSDASGKTDDEIAQLAWENIKESFQFWRDSVANVAPILGSAFTPLS